MKNVKVFSIDDDCWLNYSCDEEEVRLLASYDGRRTEETRKSIYDFMVSECEKNKTEISLREIKSGFVDKKNDCCSVK